MLIFFSFLLFSFFFICSFNIFEYIVISFEFLDMVVSY